MTNEIRIVPAIDLDPDLLLTTEGNADARFLEAFSESRLSRLCPLIGQSRMYSVVDVQKDLAIVARFLIDEVYPEDSEIILVGGYCFFEGDEYRFGGGGTYQFHREWEKGFERIKRSSVVEVYEGELRYKIIKSGVDITVICKKGEISNSYEDFLAKVEKAVNDNLKFKVNLVAELLRQGLGVREELIWSWFGGRPAGVV